MMGKKQKQIVDDSYIEIHTLPSLRTRGDLAVFLSHKDVTVFPV